ncbi:MAG: hypothetical protein M9928_00790 [Anaerolineae bacterium]|nr:hypothetical protein [Anaerolineae bacterium]MCO5187850.1 hypothetical protein [Anaerolineae bacterium]MCO5195709.1 hypothetical protein [Anaerolineae bacterium]MCO5199788.1 hypothetical protein [Anaerolineae bacterium]MCO5203545.1 hypothetical protein [Anaerolineae bacterium]
MSLTIKRIILAIISLVVGFVATYLIVIFILDTVLSDYGTVYVVLTVLSIASAVGIWLDKFMKTELLPN